MAQWPYPIIHRPKGQGSKSHSSLWLRLSAFLSLRSPKTRETYLGIVNEWCRFLGAEPGSVEAARLMVSASDMHAIAYRNWLEKRPGQKPRAERHESSSREIIVGRSRQGAPKKEGLESTLSNATIAKKFAALRRIYRMLLAANLGVRENPFDSDRVPPPPKDAGRKRPTEMLDFSKVKEVINAADESTPKGLRDKAILSVLFGGGLRRSEAIKLRVGDVRKTPAGTLYLYLRSTKAKKDARQALAPWAAKTVEKLVQERRKEKASDADYLFVSYSGPGGRVRTARPISPVGVYTLFKTYCSLAGAGKFVSPHSARATAITRLLAEGVPHREVQEFSRHSSIQMVELYDKRRLAVDQNPAKDLDYD